MSKWRGRLGGSLRGGVSVGNDRDLEVRHGMETRIKFKVFNFRHAGANFSIASTFQTISQHVKDL